MAKYSNIKGAPRKDEDYKNEDEDYKNEDEDQNFELVHINSAKFSLPQFLLLCSSMVSRDQ